MIGFNKWYMFKTDNDKRLFLDYFAYLRANQIGRYVDDELDESYPEEFLNAECLMIKIDNGYVIKFWTNLNYVDAKYLTKEEKDFILNELSKGDNKMVGCYKETATIRSIMEREYHREMRELEEKRDKLINEEYLMTEIGKQAEILADLIMANTCLKVDFRQYLSDDIMPLSIQRGIAHAKDTFAKEADKLVKKYQNLEALLSICETYEQKEKLLKKNHII